MNPPATAEDFGHDGTRHLTDDEVFGDEQSAIDRIAAHAAANGYGRKGKENLPDPAPSVLASIFKPLIDHGADWLDVPPPPREFLLRRDGAGAVARAIVMMLVAMGGRGKTMLLCQLAISVSTGTPWLDHFMPERAGRVLLVLAEEVIEEIRRRLWEAAAHLTPEQKQQALGNIYALGLAGQIVPLVAIEGTAVKTTELHAEFMVQLNALPFDVVIFDPLARVAPDVESSNAAATGAIQALEQLTQTSGKPTVIVAHHTAKWGRRKSSGDGSGGTAGARGVTGLTDAVRLVACIEGLDAKDLGLAITKSNYAQHGEPIPLVRGENGILRPPTSADLDRARVVDSGGLRRRVVEALTAEPGMSKRALRAATKGNAAAVDEVVEDLIAGGLVRNAGTDTRHRYEVCDAAE